ncbi:MAG: GH32 C-terminal domain-containing protein [Clostridia bacterium]|nr:GH32 C-terminal domain-containing protein [Clostridia bacterium]
MKKRHFLKILTALFATALFFGVVACNNTESGSSSGKNEIETDPMEGRLTFELNFDEESGNDVFDNKGDAYPVEYVFANAVFKGDEEVRRISRSAIKGNCLAFDGYSNYIEIPNSRAGVTGESFTIDVFVAPRFFEYDGASSWENGNEKLQVIVGQRDLNKNGFVLGMHKYGDWSFQLGTGSGWIKCSNPIGKELERYEWNHLTCVYDAEEGKVSIYKNGELINSVDCAGKVFSIATVPMFVGMANNSEVTGNYNLNMFNGLMDELCFYSGSFTAEEVAAHHAAFCDENGNLKQAVFEDVWLDETILDDDMYKPQYHAAPPQHWMNEPHALFYYNGNYHLFYQFNPIGPYWRNICWGHWVSPDMVNWRNVKEAIVMTRNSVAPDGIWSGNAAYRADGTPVLFFTAGNDSRSENPHSNQNVAIATPKDLSDPDLIEWEMSESCVAILTEEMGYASEFRDPNVYYEDGTWYMVVGSRLYSEQGTAFIYSTTDDSFLNWEYHGSVLELNNYPRYFGQTWELVNLTKVFNESRTVSKYLFVLSPAGSGSDNDVYYFLGDFDKETKRFIPESETPQLMDYGNNSFTGPTITTLPDGRVMICSIIQGQRSGSDDYNAGYAHTAGVPRQLSLDDEGNLKVTPIKELENLHDGKAGEGSVTISDKESETLSIADGDKDMIHLSLKLSDFNDGTFTIRLKETENGNNYAALTLNADTDRVTINTRNVGGHQRTRTNNGGDLEIDGDFTVEIYIDHAMIEIYLNGYKTITAMAYNTGTGITFGYEGESEVKADYELYFMHAIGRGRTE